MILAIFPPNKYFVKLNVSADIYAMRLLSQRDENMGLEGKACLFDEFIDPELARKYNKIAQHEALNHSVHHGVDCTSYKDISFSDINYVVNLINVLIPCYREALSLLSLIEKYHPTEIIISSEDRHRTLFTEICEQVGINFKVLIAFGVADEVRTDLIEHSNNALNPGNVKWYSSEKVGVKKKAVNLLINLLTSVIRLLRGDKPFILINFYVPLYPIIKDLINQKSFYVLTNSFDVLRKTSLTKAVFSGMWVLPLAVGSEDNKELEKIVSGYKQRLEELRKNQTIGVIEYHDVRVTITQSIIDLLVQNCVPAFNQIKKNIDQFEPLVEKKRLKGGVVVSDSVWHLRLMVKILQKYKRTNILFMNGVLGDDTRFDGMIADKVLCYGESNLIGYFRDRNNTVVVGNPLFEKAFRRRTLVTPRFPIKKVLIGSLAFSPNDINCHYSDSEIYLLDVITILRKVMKEHSFDLEIYLKPHPSGSMDYFSWFLSRNNFNEVVLIRKGDFQTVVSEMDLVINTYSTSLLEAAIMGIPVIFYNLNNQRINSPFDFNGLLPSALTRDDFYKVLNRVF